MDRNYVNRTITDHEELVLAFGYHWTYYLKMKYVKLALIPQGVGLGAALLNLMVAAGFNMVTWWVFAPALIVYGLAMMFWWSYITSNVRIVTSRRIIYKKGFLSRETNEIKLSAIEAITIEQDFIGRTLRVATLNIIGRGDGNRLRFEAVGKPIRTKHKIESINWQEPVRASETG